jgi:glycosyltransferase involved in cell wall biosynthesis
MGTEDSALTLSIVVPVHDEAARVGETVEAARAAVDASPFAAEIVVVDDGSSDGSGDVAERAGARVVRQENRGRFAARLAGLEAATGEFVLFLDSRVRLDPGALAFVEASLERGRVWNGHVRIEAEGNPYGRFWDVLSGLVFARYFDDPRTTSFDVDGFDAYPKGTTCFFAPRALLLEAFAAFESRFADTRHANDDTPLIRWIAERERIWISPEFACVYRPRDSLGGFVRHAYHRGVVFVDGHGRKESSYRPAVLAFYPAAAAATAGAVLEPLVVPALAGAVAAGAAAAAARKHRSAADVAAFAALAPVYAVSHGLGMVRALTLRRR